MQKTRGNLPFIHIYRRIACKKAWYGPCIPKSWLNFALFTRKNPCLEFVVEIMNKERKFSKRSLHMDRTISLDVRKGLVATLKTQRPVHHLLMTLLTVKIIFFVFDDLFMKLTSVAPYGPFIYMYRANATASCSNLRTFHG